MTPVVAPYEVPVQAKGGTALAAKYSELNPVIDAPIAPENAYADSPAALARYSEIKTPMGYVDAPVIQAAAYSSQSDDLTGGQHAAARGIDYAYSQSAPSYSVVVGHEIVQSSLARRRTGTYDHASAISGATTHDLGLSSTGQDYEVAAPAPESATSMYGLGHSELAGLSDYEATAPAPGSTVTAYDVGSSELSGGPDYEVVAPTPGRAMTLYDLGSSELHGGPDYEVAAPTSGSAEITYDTADASYKPETSFQSNSTEGVGDDVVEVRDGQAVDFC